jgi:CheY-like chemotaxis protein
MNANMDRRILIADDECNIRAVLRIALEGAGYAVEEATDGAEELYRISNNTSPLLNRRC